MKDSFYVSIYRTSHALPYAISMRADYRAEHQQGIDELLRSVGAKPESIGLERYRTAPAKDDVIQVAEGHVYGWRVGRKSKLRATLLIGVPQDLSPGYIVEVADRDKALNATWDGRNFLLSGRDPESAAFLREISVEAQAGNVLVYQGMNPINPVDSGCLMLLVESRAPSEVLAKIVELQERYAI